MYRIEGKIKGVAPILFNRMLENELEPGGNGSSSKGRVSQEDRITEAHQRAYRNETGIYLPGISFKKCLLMGASKSGLKVGRGGITSYIEASVFADPEMPFGKDEPDFIHEHWGRRPPKTGGACIIRRPAFNVGWEVPFGLSVVDDRRTPPEIRRCMEEAGLLVGIGSWRPEYGRFIIIEWNVIREEK